MTASNGDPAAKTSGVQSVHRTLDVLEALAGGGGRLQVAEIAAAADLPIATTHRLVRTLVERGYLRQLADRTYALGFRLVPLGAAASLLMGSDVDAVLRELVDELGETANVAVLSGDQAEYVAQVPSRFTMRMFTEIGRRVDLHSTGVGKALLSQLSADEVAAIVRRRGMPRHTEHTIQTELALRAELDRIRQEQFAIDEEEQELGVRCVAVGVPAVSLGGVAVSVSGPTARMTPSVLERAVPLLHVAAKRLAVGLVPSVREP